MPYLNIDRLEEGFAVCEDERGFQRLLLQEQLPEGAGEGSVLFEDEDGRLLLDEDETRRRRARLAKLQEDIFK